MNFEYHAPPAIIFGKESRLKITDQIKSLRLKNPLVVSDDYLYKSGVVGNFTELLTRDGFEFSLFTEIKSEPVMADVSNALDIYNENNCDGVICIGGGSAIDTAKAVAVMAVNPGSIADYMGYQKVKNHRVPLIVIPTTAGTGSESTRITIITNTDTDVKMMCLDNAFMPDISIIDYELTLSMPKSLTAYAGMDALTHALEAYVSVKANLVSDLFAMKAITLISNNILAAYNDPDDEIARENMLIGSNLAGTAFSNSSVCAVHGMSRPIGANFHVPHGLSNSMLLPVVTERSIPDNVKRYAEAAVGMGFDPGLDDEILASNLMEKIRFFNSSFEIPNLSKYGVDKTKFEEAVPSMIEAAIASGSMANNPTQFSPEEMSDIYLTAYTYE